MCTFEHDVYLPDDLWVHLWTGEVFEGGLVSVEAPIGYPTVFYRKDSSLMPIVLERMREQGLDIHP